MTPKEKAKEMFLKFFNSNGIASKVIARKDSLLAIEEIENALIDCGELSDQLQNMDRELNFWQNVRKEIETM